MDENLRFEPGRKRTVQTIQDFSDSMGILRARKCNGSVAGNRPQLVEVCVQVIERR
jgi:hypothetical protein